ncbi:MAG: hypothetical protein HY827_03005 [Actinobacteria bacterium]|nr:hypothetical protein [Actinomycetota bacterium]
MIAAGFAAAFPDVSSAAPGDLDGSFGSGGVLTVTANPDFQPSDALQVDGKIVIAGYGYRKMRTVIAVAEIDPVSGNSVFTDIPVTARRIVGFVVQKDGRFLLLYQSKDGTHLARLNPDLSLDSVFGTGGVATLEASVGSIFRGISVFPQTDGAYLVAGDTSASPVAPHHFTLGRVTPEGALDATYGAEGFANTGVLGIAAHAIQTADGKIVVAGLPQTVARINGDGSLDSTFGNGGVMVNPLLAFGAQYGAISPRRGGGLLILVSVGSGKSQGIFVDNAGNRQSATQPTALNKFSVIPGNRTGFFVAGSQAIPPGLAVESVSDTGSVDRTFGIAGSSIPVYAHGASLVSAFSDTAGRTYLVGASYSGTATSIVRLLGSHSGLSAPYRTITQPKNMASLSGSRLRFEGLSSPADAVVQLALRRVEGKSRWCQWWSSRAQRFKRQRNAGRGGCSSPRYFSIGRGPSWRYSPRRRLRAGRYQLFVRAKLAVSGIVTPLTTEQDGYRTFTVRG